MAITGSGISLGDAVLNFVANTTQLDAALARINSETAAKLQPAAVAVGKVGDSFDQAGASATTAGVAAGAATTQIQQLAQRLLAEGLSAKDAASALVNLGYSEKEAAAAAGVLTAAAEEVDVPLKKIIIDAPAAGAALESMGTRGIAGAVSTRIELQAIDQALGVRIPRGITSLLASLPGVGPAIEAAFSAAVVFFLVEAIVKLTEKITQFVADTFIYTEAMKRADEITALMNKQLAAQVVELQKLKDAYDLLNLHGTAKTSEEFQLLTVNAEKNAKALRDVSDQAYALKNGLVTLPETIGIVNARIAELYKDLPAAELAKKLLPSDADMQSVLTVLHDFGVKFLGEVNNFNQQKATLEKTYDAEALTERIANEEAKVAATKKIADAGAAVELQQALIRNAQLKISYLEDARAQSEANETKYQNTLRSLEQQKAIEAQKLGGDVGQLEARRAQEPKQAAAIDAQIQDVQSQHAAKMTQIDGEIVAAEENHQAEQLANRRKYLEERQKLNLTENAQKDQQLQSEIAQRFADTVTQLDKEDAAAKKLTQTQLNLARAVEAVNKAEQAQDLSKQVGAIEQLAALGIISEEQKAQKLKELYAREESDALASIHREIDEEQSAIIAGQARLAAAEAVGDDLKIKEAQAYLNKLASEYGITYAKLLNIQTQYDSKSVALQTQMLRNASASWSNFFAALISKSLHAGQAIQIMSSLIAQGIGQSVAAAVGGSQSFGQALEGLVKASLASLAGVAVTHVIEEIARAASDFAKAASMAADPFTAGLAPGFIAAAHAHLAAAAKWGVIGAGAAIGGAAIPGTNSSGSSSSTSHPTTGTTPSPAQGTTPQPVQVVNTQHLAGGGLFTRRTLAVIGDSPSGGNQREAVLPLGQDSSAIDEIAGRLHERMGGGSGGGDIYVTVQGMISPDNLSKVMKTMSKQINRGGSRLTVNNTYRVTKRG